MREEPILKRAGVFTDDRGTFFPADISDARWVQSNISISKKWTFRGLHHQLGETAQSKLVTVVKGRILDFIVDLRRGSFEESYFFNMSPGDQLLVPKGFVHGFLALEEDTIIQYLVDNYYSPRTEISFDWKSVNLVRELVLAEVGEVKNLHISPKDAIGEQFDKKWVEEIETFTKTV
jgi:dTDP-4-dehydrorhamnose 3,5-epimerase